MDTVSAGGAMYLSGGLGLLPVMRGNPAMVGDQVPTPTRHTGPTPTRPTGPRRTRRRSAHGDAPGGDALGLVEGVAHAVACC